MLAGVYNAYIFLQYAVTAAVGLLPFLGAVLLPTWRWLAAGLLVGGCLLGLSFGLPHLDLSLHYLLPYVLAYLGIVFLWGLALRSVVLLLGLQTPAARLIYAAGFAAVVAGPYLSQRISEIYRGWPPNEACRSATFGVKIGTLSLVMPSSPLFSLNDDISSLREAADHQKFCASYDYGRSPVPAFRLSVSFRSSPWPIKYCATAPAWAQPVCAGAASFNNPDLRPFPSQASLLLPREGLGNQLSTEEESRRPQSDPQRVFIKPGVPTPEGGSLTLSCRSIGVFQKEMADCRVGYLWRDGVYIRYVFIAPRAEIESHGLHYDAAVRRLFEGMIKP